MAIHEGAWDCPTCGRKRNRGPDKYCGGCGNARGDDVRFYLPDDAREVTDAAELARAKAGRDWNCPFCGGDNPAMNAFCAGCGAPAQGADKKHTGPPPPEAAQAVAGAAPSRPKRKKTRKSRGCLLVLVALAALAAFLIHRACPSSARLKVSGFRWERTVDIESLETLQQEGWEGEIPADARVLSVARAVHHTDRVQVGTEVKTRTVTERRQTGTRKDKVGVKDLGNGYFEDVFEERPVFEDVERTEKVNEPVYKEVPVYRNKVRYEVDRWTKTRTVRATGSDRNPHWPATALGPRDREGRKTEAYIVVFRDGKGRSYDYTARSEAQWRSFKQGARYKAKLNRLARKVTAVEGATR